MAICKHRYVNVGCWAQQVIENGRTIAKRSIKLQCKKCGGVKIVHSVRPTGKEVQDAKGYW